MTVTLDSATIRCVTSGWRNVLITLFMLPLSSASGLAAHRRRTLDSSHFFGRHCGIFWPFVLPPRQASSLAAFCPPSPLLPRDDKVASSIVRPAAFSGLVAERGLLAQADRADPARAHAETLEILGHDRCPPFSGPQVVLRS